VIKNLIGVPARPNFGDYSGWIGNTLRGEKTMTDDCLKLLEAAKALTTYIDEEHVFDKASDAGCGGFDTYRSDQFMALIKNAREAVNAVEDGLE